jgi:hypothetical protein
VLVAALTELLPGRWKIMDKCATARAIALEQATCRTN